MSEHLVLLSDLSYELGLIGIAEYKERIEVADWLLGKDDSESPRVSWRLLTLREWSHEQTKVKPIFP